MNLEQAIAATLEATRTGTWAGRVLRQGIGPCVVTIRDGHVFDVTSKTLATSRDVTESKTPTATINAASGENLGFLSDILQAAWGAADAPSKLLAPIDVQVVKAAGVTFASSMLERVIEEKARGDASLADGIRADITRLIGDDLSKLEPGSPEAMALKAVLIEKKVWSPYLEVGIGPDAEIFTKAQIMSAVGFGADVGIHPISKWNNPEPEAVVVANSQGVIVGATLGNDVNLRDVEGRSALLLGKAKDQNASASLGPFIRLFDDSFNISDVNALDIALTVNGLDGFALKGQSNMARISRSPQKLVDATCNVHHQYPDGFVLYCGTVFAPTQDRGSKGQGFTHHHGDIVAVTNPKLGALINTVRATNDCPPWQFGVSHLMRNLAGRGLL